MRQRTIYSSVMAVLITSSAFAANWAHWRGESGNGVAWDANPPIQWSETKNVKWKVAVPGRGSGSPVVWEDQVFVTSAINPAGRVSGRRATSHQLQFDLMSFDRETGKPRWRQMAIEARPHEGKHSTNSFASASPCTDGQHVYAFFGSRGLHCFTIDGDLVWQRQFGRMRTRNTFGEGASPTLVGNKIIVPWDHEGQSYLFALNKLTGDIIWRTERDEPSCWATPLIVDYGNQSQIVMNGQNYARAYDLETGEELWRCGGQAQRPVASAVTSGGLVYVGSGHKGAFLGAFRPDRRGDIEGTSSVVWTISRDAPDIASPMLSDGRLYFHKGKVGLLSCVDARTGKPHYMARRIGLGNIYASPIAAGGYVYLTDRRGTTVVIEDAEELRIVATNSVGETVDATPAPVDDQLFIRGQQHLFCIAE